LWVKQYKLTKLDTQLGLWATWKGLQHQLDSESRMNGGIENIFQIMSDEL